MNLTAEHTTYGWSVIDADGGIWWPGDDAETEIEASDDPAAEAVRIAGERPMRGEWRS